MPGTVVRHAGIVDNEGNVWCGCRSRRFGASGRSGHSGRSGRQQTGPTNDVIRRCQTSPRSSGRIRRSGMLRRDARAAT